MDHHLEITSSHYLHLKRSSLNINSLNSIIMNTLFGTCRIKDIKNNNMLNEDINYTHSTKEVIQMIQFLKGEIKLQDPFSTLCFRTGIIKNRQILYTEEFKKKFLESKLCIIEICSEKTYIFDKYYLHHLCVDPRFLGTNTNTPKEVLDGYVCSKLSYEEIEADILEIKKLIEPRKMIIVTHYDAILDTNYIEARHNLITALLQIAEKNGICIVNPRDVLKDYGQVEVLSQDLGHYTNVGIQIFTNYMNNLVDNTV